MDIQILRNKLRMPETATDDDVRCAAIDYAGRLVELTGATDAPTMLATVQSWKRDAAAVVSATNREAAANRKIAKATADAEKSDREKLIADGLRSGRLSKEQAEKWATKVSLEDLRAFLASAPTKPNASASASAPTPPPSAVASRASALTPEEAHIAKLTGKTPEQMIAARSGEVTSPSAAPPSSGGTLTPEEEHVRRATGKSVEEMIGARPKG